MLSTAIDTACLRLERLSDRFAAWLEHHCAWFIAIFSAIYFPASVLIARRRAFWYDELFTYYIARASDFSQMRAMLEAKIDHHPPAFFLMMRAAGALVDDPHIAYRLLSIAGFWLACVCLFVFVRRRTNALYGAGAALAPFMLNSFHHGLQARPYALVLGFTALALVAWQSAAIKQRRRAVPLLGLFLAISAAVSSSYFAVLGLAALGVGELWRTFERERIDWPVWIAIIAGASVAMAHLPLVVGSVSGFGGRNWASPYPRIVYDIYGRMISGIAVPLVACFILTTIWLATKRPAAPEPQVRIERSEVVAGSLLLLQPVFGYVLAVTATNKITDRYVIGMVLGFAIVAGFVVYYATRGSSLLGTAFLCVFAVMFAVQLWFFHLGLPPAHLPAGPISAEPELPVVIDDPLAFFEIWHYDRGKDAGRLQYVVDRDASERFVPRPLTGLGLLLFRDFIALPISPLAEFRSRQKRFYLFTNDTEFGWILQKYLADGAGVRLKWAAGQDRLFLVDDSK